jgi:excisionase family DNA binding protein
MPGSGPVGERGNLNASDLISLQQAAKLSGLSSSHLRRLVSLGEMWGTKIGRNWLTTERAVREYLAREHRPGPKSSSKRS